MVHSVVALPNGGVVIAEGNELRRYSQFGSSEPDARFEAQPNIVERAGLSPCGKYIVGILPNDKAIVVLSSETLEVVSRRAFTKRPSAWTIPSSDTLLVADKLGDVYSVPLLSTDAVINSEGQPLQPPILGHISVLLDIAVTDGHLFTADRDEHIRVSNYPNAFIIDKFLFGHNEYVSRLAIFNEFLLSGGGDDFVICWNWKTGEEVARFKLDGPDVLNLKISSTGQAWISRENTSKITVVNVPSLEEIKTIEVDGPVQDISLVDSGALVAVPNGIVKVNGGEQTKMTIEGASDARAWSAATLRKPEFARQT